MTLWIVTLGMVAASPPGAGAGHVSNPIYRELLQKGWNVGPTVIDFPNPLLDDDPTPDEERAALESIAGSERAVREFCRDSVTAPFVLKSRDVKLDGADNVRRADLWFVVRAPLSQMDPKTLGGGAEESEVEAGNMRVKTRRLGAGELEGRGISAPTDDEWYVRSDARLLDRIAVSSTARIKATRDESSWVVASRTEPIFDDDPTLPNRWAAITRRAGREQEGKPRTYAGGASYVKVTELKTVPGALLVEAHFAFAEPGAWFDGAPILRSKLSLIAQDRIRALRRELVRGASR